VPKRKDWWLNRLRTVLGETSFIVPDSMSTTFIEVDPAFLATHCLLLDQTAPQTVTGAAPIFSEGITVGPPGFIQCDGNFYLGFTDPTADLFIEQYCNESPAHILRSAHHPDYSQFAFGLNTVLGYFYFQSNAHGTGATLPITFWVGVTRAWDISTAGHLLAGGTGDTAQNIQTAGTIHCHGFENAGNHEIYGNYYIKGLSGPAGTAYYYIMGTGSGLDICAINVPFQLKYGALGSSVALSVSSVGDVIWNYEAANADFTIRKQTAGDAYYYNAGADKHTFSGTVNVGSLPVHINNAAAIVGGLVAGDLYRTGGDPDPVCVVH
jgi:hypothetical protein